MNHNYTSVILIIIDFQLEKEGPLEDVNQLRACWVFITKRNVGADPLLIKLVSQKVSNLGAYYLAISSWTFIKQSLA